MPKALQKLLFIDTRTKDFTARGKVIYALCILALFIPAGLIMYSFLFPKIGDSFSFVIALVIVNWLALPIKELLYSHFTFASQAKEMKRKADIFKPLGR